MGSESEDLEVPEMAILFRKIRNNIFFRVQCLLCIYEWPNTNWKRTFNTTDGDNTARIEAQNNR